MEIIRNHRKKPFTMVSNDALSNPELSTAAKGLYAVIQMHVDRPNWTIRKSYLMSLLPETKYSFDKMWDELIDLGYLKRTREHSKDTGRFQYSYELHETAKPEPKDPEPKKTKREMELEKELEALKIQYEALKKAKQAAVEPEGKDSMVCDFTVTHDTRDGETSDYIIPEDIHNTYITPKPPQGACVGDSDRNKSEYDSIIEPLEELLPEDVQKDSKHIRKIGKAVKDLSIEQRVSFLTAASRNYEESNSDIGSPVDFYVGILKKIIENPQRAEQKAPDLKKSKGKIPRFCDFEQRQYDYDDLQKKLSGNG